MSKLTPKSRRPSQRTSAVAFVAAPPEPDDPLLGFAPYVHKAPRRNSITPDKQREFIAVLAATGIVTQAARAIGTSLEALYNLRGLAGAEGFAAAWEAALDRGVARLEDTALALALEGQKTPIVSGGQLLGWYRRHNTGFIQFLLRQRRPERFGAEGISVAALAPGHPLYDKLQREWEAAETARRDAAEPDARASFQVKIDLFTARVREAFKDELRRRGAEAMLAESDAEEAVGRRQGLDSRAEIAEAR